MTGEIRWMVVSRVTIDGEEYKDDSLKYGTQEDAMRKLDEIKDKVYGNVDYEVILDDKECISYSIVKHGENLAHFLILVRPTIIYNAS